MAAAGQSSSVDKMSAASLDTLLDCNVFIHGKSTYPARAYGLMQAHERGRPTKLKNAIIVQGSTVSKKAAVSIYDLNGRKRGCGETAMLSMDPLNLAGSVYVDSENVKQRVLCPEYETELSVIFSVDENPDHPQTMVNFDLLDPVSVKDGRVKCGVYNLFVFPEKDWLKIGGATAEQRYANWYTMTVKEKAASYTETSAVILAWQQAQQQKQAQQQAQQQKQQQKQAQQQAQQQKQQQHNETDRIAELANEICSIEASVNAIMKLKDSAFAELTSASAALAVANDKVITGQKRKKSAEDELTEATAALATAQDDVTHAEQRHKMAKEALDKFKLNNNTDALNELFAAARKCSNKPPVQQLD